LRLFEKMKKATQNMGKTIPLSKINIRLHYNRVFSREEYDKISYGLIPQEMEDKWFIYFQNHVLCLHRSWTGFCIYQLTFQDKDDGYTAVETLANIDKNQSPVLDAEYHIQLLDFLISNLLLGESKPFPLPKQINIGPPGAFQHHIAGTGYPETRV
jgi:hypothetical protein